ncbi:MAG: hypothetical protein IT458_11235 [Planctomycetes bacterium]|nr:hypothetical protein [Planctomycetota bacterium]
MTPTEPSDRGQLVEKNPDGTFTKETLQRAMKALRKRLKLARLDAESKLGRNPLTKGARSTITGVQPPEQYPKEVWQALAAAGRIRDIGHGLYEVPEAPAGT